MYDFSVDYRAFGTNNVIDILKYLMKKHDIDFFFRLIRKIFIGLLISILNASNHTTLINIHPNEYRQEVHYYAFAVKLDRCVGSYNTLNDLSNKVRQKI